MQVDVDKVEVVLLWLITQTGFKLLVLDFRFVFEELVRHILHSNRLCTKSTLASTFGTDYIIAGTYGTDYIISGTYGEAYILLGLYARHILYSSC